MYVSKCNLLHLGPPHTFGEYTIDGSVMISNDAVRDLGVLIDNRLKFHEHVSTVTKKANRILAILHKTVEYMDGETFVNLYKSFVRPILEYGNIVWDHTTSLIRDLLRRCKGEQPSLFMAYITWTTWTALLLSIYHLCNIIELGGIWLPFIN